MYKDTDLRGPNRWVPKDKKKCGTVDDEILLRAKSADAVESNPKVFSLGFTVGGIQAYIYWYKYVVLVCSTEYRVY